MERVVTDGKHLRLGDAPYRVKGVTYGHFAPRGDGFLFPETPQVVCDLTAIAEQGFTVVRTYSVPPADLLDTARALGLRLLVGLRYDDWRMHAEASRGSRRQVRRDGNRAVREALATLAERPEVLAVSVGNEVPSDIVRIHGRTAVEDTLAELVDAVHAGDRDMLATYTGYPTSEYLRVEGQDLATFNVFLERVDQLAPYLRHLQRVSEDRPLVLTELGLAAEVHGDGEQARSLEMQLALVDTSGCAGATVFSWTDDWAVGTEPVFGWGFGLTRLDRSPRPSLEVVSRWARRETHELRPFWPTMTVVVCAYNEERRLGQCLDSLVRVAYPGLQVLVCDDGSTDRTLEIARRSPFEVLALPHGGLSAARNAGLAAARGEIVAYLDADATCHPEWPFHLALAFEDPGVVVAGGPNLPWPDAGLVERAVALSPGNPAEVLVGDDRAEHVPGCNLAVRRAALEGIGGFDVGYTTAGDDVDVCWRLMELGGRIGFSPAAQVHHRRRGTVRGYLRQQHGYGEAERMLSGQHRHRFNRLGAARWAGFVYGGPRILSTLLRPVVYHGPMGSAPFQTEVRDRSTAVSAWASALIQLAVAVGLLAAPFALLDPAFLAVPAVVAALLATYAVCVAAAVHPGPREKAPWRLRALVGLLHVVQPVARMWGRLHGRPLPPRAPVDLPWTGRREDWLRALQRDLSSRWCAVRTGPSHDTWDLQVAAGPLLRCRLRTAVRWEWDPVVRRSWRVSAVGVAALAATAVLLLVAAGVAAVVAGALLVMAAVETTVLLRLTGGALDRTTAELRSRS
jgi:O-antigen biosynthesis protein